MGFQLSPEGVSPAPSMIVAIVNMPKPADPHAVQRYLGMLNFLARFCPKLSDAVKPLRELTHKDVTFQWTDSHYKAFVESKELIAHYPWFVLFQSAIARNPSGRFVWCWHDGVLLQNDQPVACYSNTVTAPKQPYTVTKKEYLAIFLAFEKWDSLLYEKSTTKSSAPQEYLQETSTKNHGDYKP